MKDKFTIEDPWLGKRTISNGYVAMIRDQLKLLHKFKNDGRVPSKHLLNDIKVYEYILEHPDAELMAKDYMNKADQVRRETQSLTTDKMQIAKLLGWFQ
jgi:hypothetical protein